MEKRKIRVLIVEDSPVERELLADILDSDPDIEIAGIAVDGAQAVMVASGQEPDVILMDLHLPKLNGFEATQRIMETRAVPIIIVTGSVGADTPSNLFQALGAGALTLARKPAGPGHPAHETETRELIDTVKLMSEVKLVTRHARLRAQRAAIPAGKPQVPVGKKIEIVAFGASVGGPAALRKILTALPKDFPIPVLIVQHIAAGFVQGFSDWLGQVSGFPVRVAVHGERPLPGHAYLAPEGFQMGMDQQGRITLGRCNPEDTICPSVSHLFRSLAGAFGRKSVGVLLTGMGSDGSAELKQMREAGAMTIAQDRATSVVHGMPGTAIQLGAATEVLAIEEIAPFLTRLILESEKIHG